MFEPDVKYGRVPSSSASATGFYNSPPTKGVARTITFSPPIKPWTPIPLRKWFVVSLLSFMLVVAVGLQIALHFSNIHNGWRVPNALAATTGFLHFVYTLPPVAIAMVIVSLWAWSDVNIKRMQPYIDLAYGNAPASKSMLLDYSTQHAALVSYSAYHHRHYIVALSSLMVLTGLAVQPVAASLFSVKQTWWDSPNINVTSFEVPGLDPNLGNLTAFPAAAGFVQAHALYGVPPPNFINDIWAVAKVEVPSDQVANGTMFVNTTSVRSLGNCKGGEASSIAPSTDGTGFTLSGTSKGCDVNISVQTNGTLQYGVDTVTCPNSPPPDPLKPVVFWILNQPSPGDTPAYSLVYCTPTINLLNVTALVSLQTGDLQSAAIVSNYTPPNNITDPNGILQGRALNGIAFDLNNTDSIAQQRAQDARTGLTAAIIQTAQLSPGGLNSQMQSFNIVSLTESIYESYLSLVAKEYYFVPSQGFMEVGIKTFQPRLIIVEVTAQVLTAILISFAFLGAAVHILHHRTRDLVILPRKPGTLASAAAFTARSNVGEVLDGHLDEEALIRNLKDKRFRIDKMTGRIVMEGDERHEGDNALPDKFINITREVGDRE